MTGKYNKTSSLFPEAPFPNLSDLSTQLIGIGVRCKDPALCAVIYPTDHVEINPRYGTFQK